MQKNKHWILIIEDDTFLVKAYHVRLEHENIEAKIAENAEEAMQILKEPEKPSVIILDLMLPGKNGFDLLEELRETDDLKNIPVILLTNLAQEKDIRHGMDLGAKEYLIKANTKIETIVEKIKQYLTDAK